MKRRTFLRGIGGAALAAPFLPSLGWREARAQTISPQRLIILYTQNGCLVNRWFPTVEDGPIDASNLVGTTLGANTALRNEGLEDVASKLLFARGLAMYPKGTINGYFDPHDQGMGSKLTAAPIDSGGNHYSTGRSLDHEVAELFNPGGATPLLLSVGFSSTNVKQVLSYSEPLTPYPPETNPRNVYSALTGVFNSASTADVVATEADFRVTQGNSVIDLVRDDLTTFQGLNMSVADQQKVSDWLDLLRQTEVSVVSAACNADNAAALGLTDDTAGGGGGSSSFGGGFGGGGDAGSYMVNDGDLMIQLIALTAMCDTNRSIIMHWPGFVTFNFDGMTHEYDHHGLSHRNGSAAVGGTCVSGVLDMLNEIDNWYAGRYAKLVKLLNSISEGERTLLDNSATMWLPELADGNAHNNNNLPIVIAGSLGGYLKQGVSVNVEGGEIGTGDSEGSCANGGTDVGFGGGSRGGNVPLNKLYTTLLNGLGQGILTSPIESFGLWDSNSEGISDPGELDGLKA